MKKQIKKSVKKVAKKTAKKVVAKTKVEKAPKNQIDIGGDLYRTVSVIVPSLNESWAKTLILSENKYKKLQEQKKSAKKQFCLALDANPISGKPYNTGGFVLDEEQFKKLLKKDYNSTLAVNGKGEALKNVK
jgi:hypothetical protein